MAAPQQQQVEEEELRSASLAVVGGGLNGSDGGPLGRGERKTGLQPQLPSLSTLTPYNLADRFCYIKLYSQEILTREALGARQATKCDSHPSKPRVPRRIHHAQVPRR